MFENRKPASKNLQNRRKDVRKPRDEWRGKQQWRNKNKLAPQAWRKGWKRPRYPAKSLELRRREFGRKVVRKAFKQHSRLGRKLKKLRLLKRIKAKRRRRVEQRRWLPKQQNKLLESFVFEHAG